jgi:hypothetical protein
LEIYKEIVTGEAAGIGSCSSSQAAGKFCSSSQAAGKFCSRAGLPAAAKLLQVYLPLLLKLMS